MFVFLHLQQATLSQLNYRAQARPRSGPASSSPGNVGSHGELLELRVCTHVCTGSHAPFSWAAIIISWSRINLETQTKILSHFLQLCQEFKQNVLHTFKEHFKMPAESQRQEGRRHFLNPCPIPAFPDPPKQLLGDFIGDEIVTEWSQLSSTSHHLNEDSQFPYQEQLMFSPPGPLFPNKFHNKLGYLNSLLKPRWKPK